MSGVVGRFAPSPSGRMHLGNVFSGLLAWLSARSQDGEMVLRMEDLDPDRTFDRFAALIREDLTWLGLDWDREVEHQRTRGPVYARYLEQLQELLYPCWCSRSDLRAPSAPHASDGTPIYAGTCRNLTPEQRAAKGRPGALRIRVPDRELSFVDGLQGLYSENLARDCGDFVLRRADGVHAYQLAVVVDDWENGVTEVVRGRDLLGSTLRQMYLQELLGFDHPAYCHVPMLLAADGHRLSKRERDLDMGVLRQRYTPEQLIGQLACACGLLERPEPVTARELAGTFSWSRVRNRDIVL